MDRTFEDFMEASIEAAERKIQELVERRWMLRDLPQSSPTDIEINLLENRVRTQITYRNSMRRALVAYRKALK